MRCLLIFILISIGIVLLYILFTIFCSFIVNTKKEYKNDSKLYRFLLNSWSGFAIRIARVKVLCTGLEKIPADRVFLVVGNHRSNFDPIITWYVLRKFPIAYISKEENFRIPFFGRIIRKCCFMPIDRKNPMNAMKAINSATDLLKSGKLSVGVYPEGTRNKTKEPLLSFHDGVFLIAKKAKAPIVVITLKNTDEIYKNFPLRYTKVFLEVSEVIPAEYVFSARTAEIGARVKEIMLGSLEKVQEK